MTGSRTPEWHRATLRTRPHTPGKTLLEVSNKPLVAVDVEPVILSGGHSLWRSSHDGVIGLEVRLETRRIAVSAWWGTTAELERLLKLLGAQVGSNPRPRPFVVEVHRTRDMQDTRTQRVATIKKDRTPGRITGVDFSVAGSDGSLDARLRRHRLRGAEVTLRGPAPWLEHAVPATKRYLRANRPRSGALRHLLWIPAFVGVLDVIALFYALPIVLQHKLLVSEPSVLGVLFDVAVISVGLLSWLWAMRRAIPGFSVHDPTPSRRPTDFFRAQYLPGAVFTLVSVILAWLHSR